MGTALLNLGLPNKALHLTVELACARPTAGERQSRSADADIVVISTGSSAGGRRISVTSPPHMALQYDADAERDQARWSTLNNPAPAGAFAMV